MKIFFRSNVYSWYIKKLKTDLLDKYNILPIDIISTPYAPQGVAFGVSDFVIDLRDSNTKTVRKFLAEWLYTEGISDIDTIKANWDIIRVDGYTTAQDFIDTTIDLVAPNTVIEKNSFLIISGIVVGAFFLYKIFKKRGGK